MYPNYTPASPARSGSPAIGIGNGIQLPQTTAPNGPGRYSLISKLQHHQGHYSQQQNQQSASHQHVR